MGSATPPRSDQDPGGRDGARTGREPDEAWFVAVAGMWAGGVVLSPTLSIPPLIRMFQVLPGVPSPELLDRAR